MKKILFLLFGLSFLLFSCKTQNSITPYEYALLSAHVYQDGSRVLPDQFKTFVAFEEKEKSLSGHVGSFLNALDLDKVVELSKEEEKDGLIGYLAIKAVAAGGYYGQAYLHPKTNQVIIAHRGTENLLDAFSTGQQVSQKTKLLNLVKDLDDDYEIFSGKIPRAQYWEARAFTQRVKELYEKEYQQAPQIIHTGHSLGAVLAELCAVEDGCKAITFESPGTAPLLKELESLSGGAFDAGNFDPKKADVITYNAEPNRINTLHPHLGKVIPLYKNTEMPHEFSEDELFQSIETHAIDSILLRFNPKTGKPKFQH